MHDANRPTQPQEPDPRDTIAVRSDSERIALIQLAARWAERFGDPRTDTRGAVGERFRIAFDYLDAVIHGLKP